MKYYTPDDFEITEHFIIAKFKYDEKALKKLQDNGLIEKHGVGKATYYIRKN